MVGEGSMADGLTTATGTLALGGVGTFSIATFFPGIDLSAVIGAFGGAFFFILFAKDINAWQRAGYLVVGWIGGYFSAAEILAQAWTKTSGLSSFFGGLVCVVVCISIIESIDTGKFPEWILAIFGKFLGRGKPE